MSSTDIVADARLLIQNKLLPAVPSKWQEQLRFGLEAFALRPFQSAGSNARSVVANTNTAASKMLRLLANQKLAASLGSVFDQLKLVRPGSYVNVDHSDFDGLTALVGAVQTRNGRAIPCMVETTYALHLPAPGAGNATKRTAQLRQDMLLARQQQSFTGHTIDALQDLADRLGFWPRLVFDRGFANASIVEHLSGEGAIFYIRLKSGNYAECDGQQIRIGALHAKDAVVQLFGLRLRVVRSPKGKTAPEPWYILTNDLGSSRNKVVGIYYYRFEIEETFKDTKHLFELHRLLFDRPTSLKVVLWLVFLGIALLYRVTRPKQHQSGNTNAKKHISWIRAAYERFQRTLTTYRALTGLTPRRNSRGQV